MSPAPRYRVLFHPCVATVMLLAASGRRRRRRRRRVMIPGHPLRTQESNPARE
ncbi:hypothetical protein E2C01_097785 [Portunus trituberculatus]|uniref:Uncharacterized protein n=1 Tax=Portunus trituberculatus TaxID=210409 RepID=A0A5B7KAG2_PORTR|nr:hypothetical protein [Portunus trituberculatus]